MTDIDSESVDMILTDLPYGTTACKWDSVIPLDRIWEQYIRIAKKDAAIVLTSAQPFTSALVMSNPKMFKYEWIWDKKIPSGMSYARFQPMRQHESVLVFSRGTPIYFPQMTQRDKPIRGGGMSKGETTGNEDLVALRKTYDQKNPTTILRFDKVRLGSLHPTQKPVPLFEYLIRTYTKQGDLVLDSCAGSGTTGVACLNSGRDCILIERDATYYQIMSDRLQALQVHMDVRDLGKIEV